MTMAAQQMTFEILLNSSVEGKDVLRLSNQAQKIYSLLQRGPVTTSELVAVACQYSARLNEIRHSLIKIGLMIDEIPGDVGENQYRIVPIEESSFWQKVINKGEELKWV